jgi:hypothetical protein
MTDAVEITEVAITAETIPTTVIGSALSVKTLISHSELNVIDVENLRVKAVLTDATIDAVETIEEAEMTTEDETTDVVETNVAGEIINVVETIVETIQTMIGNVENVRIPISHSELNVTAVAHLKAVAKEHLQGTGKVMTEGLATGKQSKPLAQETGIARNVESLTLLREMTVSVVDVPRE